MIRKWIAQAAPTCTLWRYMPYTDLLQFRPLPFLYIARYEIENGEINPIFISWIGWGGSLFATGFRLNGGMYGYSPYNYIRIGPIMIKRYV